MKCTYSSVGASCNKEIPGSNLIVEIPDIDNIKNLSELRKKLEKKENGLNVRHEIDYYQQLIDGDSSYSQFNGGGYSESYDSDSEDYDELIKSINNQNFLTY